VLGWPWNGGTAGKFDFTVAANFTKTEVTQIPATAELAALNPAPPLFARVNILSFERGQPKNKLNAAVNWKLGKLGATLRATRYGEVFSPSVAPAPDVTMKPKTVVDVEARYALSSKLNLALGADNLFDAYPESVSLLINSTGNTPYSNYAPFGRGGRFVYVRASYAF
jgi:iron complex outermembrane receptor protein